MKRKDNRNRFWIMLLIMAVTIGMAIPAAAKPPLCSENPGHPACIPDDPTDPPPGLEQCETPTILAGNGNVRFECLWTPFNDGSTVATVTVEVLDEGIVGPPLVIARDDSPGDICVIEQDWEGQTGPDYVASFDLYYDTVPEGYEAWAGHSYWDFRYDEVPDPVVGAYWCAPQDPVLDTVRLDTNGTPLHLIVGFRARGYGQLSITLSPPPA